MKWLIVLALVFVFIPLPGIGQDIVTIEEDEVRFTIASKDVVKIKSSGLIGPAGPVGSIVMWPTENVPEGYLVCDGRAVSRLTYADLFSVIGEMYGSGDGSTTFDLPDLRGMFVRGWSETRNDQFADPDKESRLKPEKAGATIPDGNHVGTIQSDTFKRHRHHSDSQGSCSIVSGGSMRYPWDQSYGGTWETDYEGGSETRPKNISMMFIIKY